MEKRKMKTTAIYVLTGVAAGAINGFFGGGGGMIIVPALKLAAKLEQKKALATSVAIIMPLSLLSATIYLMRGGLQFQNALPYLIGGLAGGIAGGLIFTRLNANVMGKLLGIVIIISGIRLAIL